MGGVGPADMSYATNMVQDYRRAMNETEDESQGEIKRTKRDADERVDETEERYRQRLRDLEARYEKTIQNMREENNEMLAIERAKARGEIDALKTKIYNRSGKMALDESVARDQLQNAQRAFTNQREANEKQAVGVQKTQDRKLKQMEEGFSQKLNQQARVARDSAMTAYNDKAARDRINQAKKDGEAKSQYENFNRQAHEDIDFERKLAARQVADATSDFDERYRRLKTQTDSRAENQISSIQEKSEADFNRQRIAFAEQNQRLREDLKNVAQAAPQFQKGFAEGRAIAIHDMENDWSRREVSNLGYYDDLLKKERANNVEHENYLTEQRIRSDQTREARYTDLIRKEVAEREAQQKFAEAVFEKERIAANTQIKSAQEAGYKSSESQVEIAKSETQRALNSQAEAYDNILREQKTAADAHIATLSEKNQKLSNTDDPRQISPAAAEHLTERVSGEYVKLLDEEHERNSRMADSQQENHYKAVREQTADLNQDLNLARKEATLRADIERQGFLSHVQDMQDENRDVVQRKDQDHLRSTTKTDKRYASLLDDQRRRYEAMLKESRVDNESRLTSLHQESEFNQKLTYRQMQSEHNNIVRKLQEQLTDEKEAFESNLKDIKETYEQKLQSVDKEKRTNLDEQQFAYEQRIAQLLQQQKEKESQIVANYERQLDEVRRANARLIQKKG